MGQSKFTIVSGSNDGVTGTTYKVQKSVIHPSYNQSHSLRNNIALVKINDSFKWNKKTKLVKLPTKEIADNTEMSVAGYGVTVSNRNLTFFNITFINIA